MMTIACFVGLLVCAGFIVMAAFASHKMTKRWGKRKDSKHRKRRKRG
jgi:hypothetical protein